MNPTASVPGKLSHFLEALPPSQVAVTVFLGVFLAYSLLLPGVARGWIPTGDEPHYLLMTHSLLYDGDLDLSNNYAQGDYTRFFPDARLSPPHTGPGRDGGQYSWHSPGLPAILVPAYHFWGREGVLYALSAVASLLVTGIYLLARRVTGSNAASLVASLSLAFTPPLAHYAYLIYPETCAALSVTWGLYLLLGRKSLLSRFRLFSLGVGLGSLLWFSPRFAPLAAALALWAIWRMRPWGKMVLARLSFLLLPLIISLGGMAIYNHLLFGSPRPDAAMLAAGLARVDRLLAPEELAEGIVGWFMDQKSGLLLYSPLLLLGLPGAVLLWRNRKETARVLLSLPVAYLAFLCPMGFWVQWAMPGRYLVVLMPVAGILLAAARRWGGRSRMKWAWALLLPVSLLNAFYLVHNPSLAYNRSGDGKAKLFSAYSRRLPVDLTESFPAFDRNTIYHAYELPHQVGSAVGDPAASARRDPFPGRKVVWARASYDPPGPLFLLEEITWLAPDGYTAHFRLKMANPPPSSEPVAVLEVGSSRRGILARRELGASDFPQSGRYAIFALPFRSERAENLEIRVWTTAQADIWMDYVQVVRHGGMRSWGRAALWMIILGAMTIYLLQGQPLREGERTVHPVPLWVGRWLLPGVQAVLAVALVAAFARHRQAYFGPRQYPASALLRQVGQLVPDPFGPWGIAAYATPEADPEGLLSYGPYDFLPPGSYRASYFLRSGGELAPQHTLATLDVLGFTTGSMLAQREVKADHLREGSDYSVLTLDFVNPSRQVLEFRVHFKGLAQVWFAGVEVVPRKGGAP